MHPHANPMTGMGDSRMALKKLYLGADFDEDLCSFGERVVHRKEGAGDAEFGHTCSTLARGIRDVRIGGKCVPVDPTAFFRMGVLQGGDPIVGRFMRRGQEYVCAWESNGWGSEFGGWAQCKR